MTACRRFCLLFALSLALVAPGAAFAQVLVMVSGQPITANDVSQRIKLHQLIERSSPPQKQVLEELIDEKIKITQAARFSIEADDKEVDRMFASVAERSGRTAEQLTAGFAQSGLKAQTFKDKLRADYVWGQYVRARAPVVNVRDSDVVAALNQKGQTQMVATEYILRPIVLVVGGGSNAYGARMQEAAALRARFNGCDQGVDMIKGMKETVIRSPVSRLSSEIPEKMRSILEKTEVGRLTPPEVAQSGVELFAVCSKREVKGESEKKRDIKDELGNAQFQEQSKRMLAELRKTTLIQYR
ncbi:SurA N-terminal domain-containing protein [Azorhizobium doebereinerae]|uniref:SurA N-terminal domain-containing protein n=1 Tax=Azorhizobium doebereinerae TaxID=281091 RepID=UPI00041E5CED|nr:SurA N-terminal domain-containing protein [Azorhizobium doebereinerae]